MTQHSFTSQEQQSIAFLQGAIRTGSITGNETNFVKYLQPKMDALGLQPTTAEFLPNRHNIWGQTPSAGQGKTLLVLGHTDTVHVDGWAEKWQGTERESPFSGAMVDGEIWGRGAGDLKAGICAWLMAWEKLQSEGVKLNGRLQFAFIGDEESGEEGMGVSAGVKHYVTEIGPTLPKPDFAVYAEPSQLNVYTAQMGFFIADIFVQGRTCYFGVPEQGVDALKAAHKIAGAIFSHSEAIAKSNHHELVGAPFALITELSAGGYIAVPGKAKISLIRKLTPAENMDEAVAQLTKLIHAANEATGCHIDIQFPAGRDHAVGGYSAVTNANLPEVKLLQNCIQSHWPVTGQICAAPYWSENSFVTQSFHCGAVYCAPGDISNCHTLEERVNVKEYLAAINAYAEFIIKYCGA